MAAPSPLTARGGFSARGRSSTSSAGRGTGTGTGTGTGARARAFGFDLSDAQPSPAQQPPTGPRAHRHAQSSDTAHHQQPAQRSGGGGGGAGAGAGNRPSGGERQRPRNDREGDATMRTMKHLDMEGHSISQASAADIEQARKRLADAGVTKANKDKDKGKSKEGAKHAGQAAEEQADEDGAGEDDDEGEEVCLICAEPMSIYALGQCSHRSCHVCSLRLRALYKVLECSVCKTTCPRVIFTSSPTAPFSSYAPDSLPCSDPKLGISFESSEMMDASLSLLHFNCPDPTCDDVRRGWPDLRGHVRQAHSKSLCDLCTRHKRIFAHEFPLFTAAQLKTHETIGDDTLDLGGTGGSDGAQSGFKGHPSCDFCRIRFYDNDALYDHCKKQHEQCFLCVRNDGGRFQYFRDWMALEKHFQTDHHPCLDSECLAQKFVVFDSRIDLQAHQVEKHGASKDVRRVETNFSYSGSSDRNDGFDRQGGRQRRRGGGAGAGEGTNNGAPTVGFEDVDSQPATSIIAQPRVVPGLGPRAPERRTGPVGMDPARGATVANGTSMTSTQLAERHAALLRIVHEGVGSQAKVDAFKNSVKTYRNGEQSADDFIDWLTNFFGRDLNLTARVTAGVADLLDNEEKKAALRTAWQDFKIENEQFPSLAPTAPSINGHPAPSPSVPLQGAKRARASARAQQGGGQSAVWDRVERAAASSGASSSSRSGNYVPGLTSRPVSVSAVGAPSALNRPNAFPPLSNGPSPTLPSTPRTGWAASAVPSPVPTPRVVPAAGAAGRARGAAPSRADFPSLPGGGAAAADRARMRAALSGPPASARTTANGSASPWAAGAGSVSAPSLEPGFGAAATNGDAQGGRKKGKKIVLPLGGR